MRRTFAGTSKPMIARSDKPSRGSQAGALGAPGLLVLRGIDRGEIIDIERSPTTIGKGARADVRVLEHPIGEEHARLWIDGVQVSIEGAGPPGELRVNDAPVRTRIPLADGDRISIGEATVFRFLHHKRAGRVLWARALEALRREARTGLVAPGYLMNRLELEVKWAAEEGTSVVLVVVGIDRLHELGNSLGPMAVEVVFAQVADVLGQALRAHDVLSRYNRHGLIALCGNAGLDQGRIVAERLRERVSSHRFASEGKVIPVTISAGVAAIEENGHDLRDLVAAADLAKFRAQAEGGNQVVADREPEPPTLVLGAGDWP
jgi:two-component system, cell cycle response regulator